MGNSLYNQTEVSSNDGDWTCPCGMVNFRKRTKCFKCLNEKNKPISQDILQNTIKLKPGDKICNNCEEINFANRISCRKCNSVLTSENVISSTVNENNNIILSADWYCQTVGCNEYNFSKRISCRKCNTIKPDLTVSQNNSNTSIINSLIHEDDNNDDDNNKCVVCLERTKTCVLLNCRHMCLCNVCVYALDKCPLCRQSYKSDKDILNVFT